MKFRNISGDHRDIPALGVTVEAGETTPELSRDEAKGFTLQTDIWTAVGDDAKQTQKRAAARAEKTDVKEND